MITFERLDKALSESINHWKRMIAWMRKRHDKVAPEMEVMETELGECWSGQFCSLCKLFGYDCDRCAHVVWGKPVRLRVSGGRSILISGCQKYWHPVASASLRADWIKYALRLKDKLQLRRKELRKLHKNKGQ